MSKNLLQSSLRYKQYYGQKASAHPILVHENGYTLHPQANTHVSKIPSNEYLRTGFYIVARKLLNGNFFICRLATQKTQILQRIRLIECPCETLCLTRRFIQRTTSWITKWTSSMTTYTLRRASLIFEDFFTKPDNINTKESILLPRSNPETSPTQDST